MFISPVPRERNQTVSSSDQRTILTIDMGTSGPKVALYAMDGSLIGSEFEEVGLILLPGGGAEQRPEEWWDAIRRATKRLLARELADRRRISAVCTTTQWSGTVAVDRSGQHLMNAIIWMDSRGAKYMPGLTGGRVRIAGYGVTRLWRYLRLTGGAPGHSGKDSIAHILWIMRERPEIYGKTWKFLEPKDFINLRLTGRFAASCESMALHWLTDNRDISRIRYDDRLIRMAGIDREKLPELKSAIDILGPVQPEVAADLGMAPDVPVVMGTPDVQAAAIGSGAVEDYEGHLYLGTSSWLTCHVPFKKVDIANNMASLPSARPDRYFIANEQESAGACLTFLRDKIVYHKDQLLAESAQPDVYKLFDEVVAEVPAGSGKLIFTPWLFGERTPIEDHHIRGGFFNLSLHHTRSHMVRAVFEGVALNSRWLLDSVESFIKRPLAEINLIGGGANSDIWCRICADVLNRPINQMEAPVLAGSRGVAFLAAIALGEMGFGDIAGKTRIARTYQPDPSNRGIYDELFREFKEIYLKNRKISARLNRGT